MSSLMLMQGMVLGQKPSPSKPGHAGNVNSQHPTEMPQAVARDEEALSSNGIEHLEPVNAAPKSESDLSSQPSNPPRQFSKKEVLRLLIKSSVVWVLLGVSFMVLGIGIVQAAILPLIFTCPQGATCPNTFDLNATNVLPILQALMSYWLTIWLTVAAFGLVKLCVYQSWFIMLQDGSTVEDTDLNLGALKSSLLDASRLLFRRGKKVLCMLVLAQIGITHAIQIILSVSIIRDIGERSVTFSYPNFSHLPDSNVSNINSDGQGEAIAKVTAWALTNDTSHGPALRGSLVLPDGRSNQSVNFRAGGRRIQGDISCSGYANYKITMEGGLPQYNVDVRGRIYSSKPRTLAVSMTSTGTAVATYLWMSNASGLIPNATLTSDGGVYIALCNHTISMTDPLHTDPGVQYINANNAVVTGCGSADMYTCAADSVSNAMIQFWGGTGQSFFGVSCRGGVLGPLKTDPNNICPLSTDLWVGTITSMLDGIMQTAPTSGFAPQRLVAKVQNLSTGKWWIQAVIPFCTLVLYGVALYYTYVLSQGHSTLKELNLAEVIAAVRTGQVGDPSDSGQERSMIQYEPGVGFVRRSSGLKEG